MALTSRLLTPVGVVLAGGAGRRIGGAKARVELLGAPLITYPLAALRAALGEVVVLAKPSSVLPVLPGTEVWLEPEEPRHPLAGLVWALERAQGRPVLVCAADLPLVQRDLVARLARWGSSPPIDDRSTPLACIASDGEGPQPLLGRYEPAALNVLRTALAEDPMPRMRSLAQRLCATVLPAHAEQELLNVNRPEDLRRAAAALRRRSAAPAPTQPNVKS
ncbi:MAG: NTP transferase domain-containing protein [Actinomycetota bacterium]|nr:NTP transferase domain-containing protein [Actinomycetota bacterium]